MAAARRNVNYLFSEALPFSSRARSTLIRWEKRSPRVSRIGYCVERYALLIVNSDFAHTSVHTQVEVHASHFAFFPFLFIRCSSPESNASVNLLLARFRPVRGGMNSGEVTRNDVIGFFQLFGTLMVNTFKRSEIYVKLFRSNVLPNPRSLYYSSFIFACLPRALRTISWISVQYLLNND